MAAESSEIAHDDGLPMPEVGSWAETKYRLFRLYASLFSTGMKYKWDERVYVDLYSGAGFARVRGTRTVLAGSPILALTVADPFDKYIYCEEDPRLLKALEQRATKVAPSLNKAFIPGDCNVNVDRILAQIPIGSASHRVLGLCFSDPFDIGMKFATIKKLSDRYLDFLCLLAVYMDANLNLPLYFREDSVRVDDFLGRSDWRPKWLTAKSNGASFAKFLAEEFSDSMKSLGYIPPPLYSMKLVRSDEKNLPLYYLVLYSRSNRAYDFWDEVLKYSTDQTTLGF